MMYRVVSNFRDSKDDYRSYKVGDEYPAEGATKPTKARIAELEKGKNKYNRVFIEGVADVSAPESNSSVPRNGRGKPTGK